MVRVLRVALRDAVSVSVEVPAPVMEVGLKLPVTPLPRPLTERAMAELKPPVTVDVTVTFPLLERRTVRDVGDTLSAKLAEVDVTVSVTVVVCTRLPDVPVIVIG